QQRQPRRLPGGVPVQRVPVHRAVLPVPEGAPRLAEGDDGVGRRPLVHRPHLRPARLLARQVLVIEQWAVESGQWAAGMLPTVFALYCPLPTVPATGLPSPRPFGDNSRMDARQILGPDGLISKTFPGFESR